jgi:hypothetical protein
LAVISRMVTAGVPVGGRDASDRGTTAMVFRRLG